MAVLVVLRWALPLLDQLRFPRWWRSFILRDHFLRLEILKNCPQWPLVEAHPPQLLDADEGCLPSEELAGPPPRVGGKLSCPRGALLGWPPGPVWALSVPAQGAVSEPKAKPPWDSHVVWEEGTLGIQAVHKGSGFRAGPGMRELRPVLQPLLPAAPPAPPRSSVLSDSPFPSCLLWLLFGTGLSPPRNAVTQG